MYAIMKKEQLTLSSIRTSFVVFLCDPTYDCIIFGSHKKTTKEF